MSKIGILILLTLVCFTGPEPAGTYADPFGAEITIRPDGTFKYSWHFDMTGSWTSGKWELHGDTLKLKKIPVYDTLTIENQDKRYIKDSLVLSPDQTSNRCTNIEFLSSTISSGGQNRKLPDTLYYIRKDKLIAIKNGKLQTRKVKGFWTGKKYRPWYVKK